MQAASTDPKAKVVHRYSCGPSAERRGPRRDQLSDRVGANQHRVPQYFHEATGRPPNLAQPPPSYWEQRLPDAIPSSGSSGDKPTGRQHQSVEKEARLLFHRALSLARATNMTHRATPKLIKAVGPDLAGKMVLPAAVR